MTIKVAVLDDYLDMAGGSAHWSALGPDIELTIFNRNLASVDEAAAALRDFHVLSLMRERMALPKSLIGLAVCGTRSQDPAPTIEIAWGLILSAARNLSREDAHMRRGGWQERLGFSLHGKTLGIVGLGHLGKRMVEVGKAFGMNIVAWSQNLTSERAAAAGVTRVDKDELMSGADVITIHLVLSDRTRGLIGAREFDLMKPSAILVNTSRGPIIDETAMISALRKKQILAACLDVFNVEPLPADHELRGLDNAILSPHLGYATQGNYRTYFADTIEAIQAWRAGTAIPRLIESA